VTLADARPRAVGSSVRLDLLAALAVVLAIAVPAKLLWFPTVESATKGYVGMWAVLALLAFSRHRLLAPWLGLGRAEGWAAAVAVGTVAQALAAHYYRHVLGLRWIPSPEGFLGIPWVAWCLGTGLFEELAFRGVVLEAMMRVSAPPVAHFVTVLAFAFVHFRPAEHWPPVVLLGVSFGLLREYARSLWPCVFAHAWVNFFLGVSFEA
jgi:membrane protease YdiL (CAAX protease family)